MRYKLVSKEMDGEQYLYKVVDLIYNKLWIYHEEEVKYIPLEKLREYLQGHCT